MRTQVRSVASLSGLRIRRCHELWCGPRGSSDLVLLWLWHRPVATALIQPLAWELPYALKRKKKRERRRWRVVGAGRSWGLEDRCRCLHRSSKDREGGNRHTQSREFPVHLFDPLVSCRTLGEQGVLLLQQRGGVRVGTTGSSWSY